MSTLLQESTLLASSADPPLPWAQWMDDQQGKIYVEFAINGFRQKIAATRTTTFGQIKEIICSSSCAAPSNLILWWMGEEMQDEMTLAEAVGWRLTLETTFHCEDRELQAVRGVKLPRSPC